MKNKVPIPPVSLFGKISMIISIGIVTASLLTLETAYRHAQKAFLANYMAASKTNMDHVKDQLLDIHSYITMTYDEFSSSNGIEELFTTRKDAPTAQLAKNILEGAKAADDIWDLHTLKDFTCAAMGGNGQLLSSDGWGIRIPEKAFRATSLYQAYLKNPGILQYVSTPKSIMGADRQKPSLVAVRYLKNALGTTPFGFLMIEISQSYFKHICSPYIYPQNNFIITDRKGLVLSGNYPDPSFSQMNGMPMPGGASVQGAQSTVLYEYVPYMDLYLFNIINKEKIKRDFYASNSSIFLVVAILTTGILLATAFVTGSISKPLKSFTAKITYASSHGRSQHLPVEGSWETRQLAQAYNHMVDEINHYNAKLMDTEKKRHAAELSALQMQINPHFLYNTLASVKFLAQNGQGQKAATVINALIAMLQNTIGKTDQLETLGEQLENLKNYADIMRLRYDNRIQVLYLVNEDCLDALLPKLLLQPIVENAFFHAFDEEGGYVKLYAALTPSRRLLCEIRDNGKGFDASKPKIQALQKNHIGLNNIKQRLALIYGEDFTFALASQPGKGTSVKIQIPCRPSP